MIHRIILSFAMLCLVAGCDARGNTPSAPDPSARLAALEAQVLALQEADTALRAQIAATAPAAVFLRSASTTDAPGSAARGLRAQVEGEPLPCDSLGTLTGRPTTGDPIRTAALAAVSCTGYLYVLNDDGVQADVAPLAGMALFFATTDCTGQAYASLNFNPGLLSPAAFNQGAVFKRGDDYLAIPAGATAETVIIGSAPNGDECQVFPPTPVDVTVTVVPNDPMVTGVASAPIAGPIVVGAAP